MESTTSKKNFRSNNVLQNKLAIAHQNFNSKLKHSLKNSLKVEYYTLKLYKEDNLADNVLIGISGQKAYELAYYDLKSIIEDESVLLLYNEYRIRVALNEHFVKKIICVKFSMDNLILVSRRIRKMPLRTFLKSQTELSQEFYCTSIAHFNKILNILHKNSITFTFTLDCIAISINKELFIDDFSSLKLHLNQGDLSEAKVNDYSQLANVLREIFLRDCPDSQKTEVLGRYPFVKSLIEDISKGNIMRAESKWKNSDLHDRPLMMNNFPMKMNEYRLNEEINYNPTDDYSFIKNYFI